MFYVLAVRYMDSFPYCCTGVTGEKSVLSCSLTCFCWCLLNVSLGSSLIERGLGPRSALGGGSRKPATFNITQGGDLDLQHEKKKKYFAFPAPSPSPSEAFISRLFFRLWIIRQFVVFFVKQKTKGVCVQLIFFIHTSAPFYSSFFVVRVVLVVDETLFEFERT